MYGTCMLYYTYHNVFVTAINCTSYRTYHNLLVNAMYSRNTVHTIICLTVSYGTFSVRYAQSVVPLPEVEAGITATLGVPDRTPAVGVSHVGSVTLRPKKNQYISYNGILNYDVIKFGLTLVTYN